jgi:hypothetical protein
MAINYFQFTSFQEGNLHQFWNNQFRYLFIRYHRLFGFFIASFPLGT